MSEGRWSQKREFKISPKQQELTDFVERFWRENAIGPSLEEMGDGIKCSPSTANVHLQRCLKKGILIRDLGKHRSVRKPIQEDV